MANDNRGHPAGVPDGLSGFLTARVGIGKVGHDHVQTVTAKPLSYPAPDAAGGSGDDGDAWCVIIFLLLGGCQWTYGSP